MDTCANPTCIGDCAHPDRAAVCVNTDCPEHELSKTACHQEVLLTINCGHCGRPCEVRDPQATTPAGP